MPKNFDEVDSPTKKHRENKSRLLKCLKPVDETKEMKLKLEKQVE